MRRLVGWIGGLLGGLTAYRLIRRRPRPAADVPPAEPDGRADELRAKLAEARAAVPVVEEPAPEPVMEMDPEPGPDSPDERRRRVHEEGRAALDEMRPE
jgi:hypothetical protein